MKLKLKSYEVFLKENNGNIIIPECLDVYTMELITNTFLTSNISMAIKPYKVC